MVIHVLPGLADMLKTVLSSYVILILSLTVHSVKSDSHVIVRSTRSGDPSICGDHAVCDTLSNLISSNPSILNNHTYSEFEFLPGTHRLEVSDRQSTIIQGERNVTWYGHNNNIITENTEIVCEHPFAFVFLDNVKIELQHLHFANCGQELPKNVVTNFSSFLGQMKVAAAISVVNADSLFFSNVEIRKSTGYGLLVTNLGGNSSILSSSFLDNGQRRSQYNTSIGGNIMMLFNSYSQKNTKSMHLLINDTFFQDGKDPTWTKNTRCYTKYDSPLPFRSNGLAVLNIQHKFRFYLTVRYTRFVGNTSNNSHPAVLLHDDSSVGNEYLFEDCSFVTEGAFRIHLQDSNFTNELAQNDVHRITVSRCSFINGSVEGIHICIHPPYKTPHRVLIQQCVFSGYKKHQYYLRTSVLKIVYGAKSLRSCPNFRVKVNSSLFHGNEVTTTLSLFNPMSYGRQMFEQCLLLVIVNCEYVNNKLFDTAVVLLSTQGNFDFYAWEYPNGINVKGVKMDQMKIANTRFINNKPELFEHGALEIKQTYVTLENCFFQKTSGTAVYVENSVVTLSGQNILTHNTGQRGGGIALSSSIIHFSLNSTTLIEHNRADFGGGVFVVPVTNKLKLKTGQPNLCSFDFPSTPRNQSNTSIVFFQNKATQSGNAIYGALYARCSRVGFCDHSSKKRVNCTYKNVTFREDLLPFIKIDGDIWNEVASVPNRLCLCSAGQLTNQCDKTAVTVFPGQTFYIPMAAVGQFNSTSRVVVKSTVCSSYYKFKTLACRPDHLDDINSGEGVQSLSPCQHLTLTVRSRKNKLLIRAEVDNLRYENGFRGVKVQTMNIRVNLKSCPTGFILVNDTIGQTSHCSCEEYILSYPNIECDERKGLIVVKGKEWIGFYKNCLDNITIHSSCPYDYCLQGVKHINLSEPDEQCSHNRSGVLCGACQTDLSVVLGTSNCKKCSNVYLVLIIPFALAGVALVVLLLKCNLTVSVGHINGIIFYANIVQVNKALLFLEQGTANHIFSTFIAWLNLDLGIETCFFENMDSYIKVWLQFVFPVYVWIVIAVVVVLAHYSTKIGRLMGSNSVPVLATLFLLSYAKLLRTIILAVAFTSLTFKDVVWLQDGNVEYFSPKHIPLFLTALTFTLLFILPLTLLVLLAPCLQARSHHKAFRWVNRLKPFLDAYQGPYSDKFRFWTGLLLILRIVLFIMQQITKMINR